MASAFEEQKGSEQGANLPYVPYLHERLEKRLYDKPPYFRGHVCLMQTAAQNGLPFRGQSVSSVQCPATQ